MSLDETSGSRQVSSATTVNDLKEKISQRRVPPLLHEGTDASQSTRCGFTIQARHGFNPLPGSPGYLVGKQFYERQWAIRQPMPLSARASACAYRQGQSAVLGCAQKCQVTTPMIHRVKTHTLGSATAPVAAAGPPFEGSFSLSRQR